MAKSIIFVPVNAASSDGRWWGRYPNGNRPPDLIAGATAQASLAGSLSTAIRLGASAQDIATIIGAITTQKRLNADALSRALATGSLTTNTVVSGAPQVLELDFNAGMTSATLTNSMPITVICRNAGSDVSKIQVWIGTSQVGMVYSVKAARGSTAKKPLQAIRCHVGSLGGQTGTLAVKVIVDGVESNTDKTFMVQPGRVFYVNNLTGNDATGAPNNILLPYRYAQRYTGAGNNGYQGIWAIIQPGDIIIYRYTGTAYSDLNNRDNAMIRMATGLTGNAPTGVVNHGYYNITAYPGEEDDILLTANVSGGMIAGCGSGAGAAGYGKYVAISCLKLASHAQSDDDGAPINFQSNADFWRVVNCDITWPSARQFPARGNSGALAGGISGNGNGIKIFANWVHDISINTGNGDYTQHGIYFDGSNNCAKNCEVAYNNVENCTGGNGFQLHNSDAADQFIGMTCHDNTFKNCKKHGLNITEATRSFDAWNNTVSHCEGACLRFNFNETSQQVRIYMNTFYDTHRSTVFTNDGNAMVTSNDSPTGIRVIHNIFIMGPGTLAGTPWLNWNGSTVGVFAYNLWYDARAVQGLTQGPPEDANRIPVSGAGNVNTIVTDAANEDFTVPLASPAANKAQGAMGFAITSDAAGNSRPKAGNAFSTVGAYEVAA